MIGDLNSLAELFPTRNLQTARQAVRHAVALEVPDLWRVYLNRDARQRAYDDAANEADLMRCAEAGRGEGFTPAVRALNDLGVD